MGEISLYIMTSTYPWDIFSSTFAILRTVKNDLKKKAAFKAQEEYLFLVFVVFIPRRDASQTFQL